MYAVYLLIALVPVVIYGIVVLLEVPGLSKERLGELEPLPPDLDQWREDRESPQGRAAIERGLVREQRLWLDPKGGWFGGERLVRQARTRDTTTGEIVSTERDRRFQRRRMRTKP